MLYFSDTVWVLTWSSSLPALDGALESSKGDTKGPCLLSRLPAESELQLDLLDDADKGECTGDGDSSRNRLGRVLEGGSSSSADSPGRACWYICILGGCARLGRLAEVDVNGRADGEFEESLIMLRMLSTPELRRMCGGFLIGGGELSGEDMAKRRGEDDRRQAMC